MNKQTYRLLAMDMDGTVLNREKRITPRTEAAIRAALKAGKEVLFATGRCPSEAAEYLALFPAMRYVVYLSGALVRDVRTGRALVDEALSPALTEQVLSVADSVDAMVTVFAGDDIYVERRRRNELEYFNCACFGANYERNAIWVDDIREAPAKGNVYKINFYCHNRAAWQNAMNRLAELPVVLSKGLSNNVEVTVRGTSKGTGLATICADADIPLSETIAVGDEDNDLSMIRVAGLGVAMANATAELREAANARTGDCDHDGVAAVIEKYLL